MERALLIAIVASVIVANPDGLRAAKRVVSCNEGSTQLNIKQVKRSSNGLGKKARRAGVHVVDLGDAGAQRVEAWRKAFAAKNWCEVNLQVQGIETLIENTVVDEAFVRAKATRIDGWVHGTLSGGRKKRASKMVGTALRELEKGRVGPANGKLNKVMTMLTGSRDLLDPPKEPLKKGTPPQEKLDVSDIVPSAAPSSGVLNASLAYESCPALEKGEPSNGELAGILERLRTEMAAKNYRAVDFKYGPELFEILLEEGRDGSRGRAAMAACVLLTRIAETRIGIGVCQGRFSRVNELRDERGVPPSAETRFTALVRQATDEIAAKRFDEAFATLDELLVLLGDPVDQSRDIP